MAAPVNLSAVKRFVGGTDLGQGFPESFGSNEKLIDLCELSMVATGSRQGLRRRGNL